MIANGVYINIDVESQPRLPVCPAILLTMLFIGIYSGNFYYYGTLPDPYLTEQVIDNVSVGSWLVSNSIWGLGTLLYLLYYMFHPPTQGMHVRLVNLLIAVSNIIWTIIGWMAFRVLEHHVYVYPSSIYTYLLVTLSIQIILYTLGCLLACSVE
jgi:hypothetical protein